ATIDRALAALREVQVATPAGGIEARAPKVGRKPTKRRMSAEGRKRISEAVKKRWAEKRAAEATPTKKASSRKKAARQGRTAKTASSTVSA
ncbi:MAG: hypothetical protein M1335_03065, partial [Chloroflexi bacterium]|nr:hypothetical protein [Chloroflexota bacterium]